MNGTQCLVLQLAALLAPMAALEASASEESAAAISPPKIQKGSSGKVGNCYSLYARRTGRQGLLHVVATIEPDGHVSQIEMPPGIDSWQEETARCVMGVLKFEPGTRDGVPVAAKVQVPLNFALEDSEKISILKVASTKPEIEDAYRKCYPPDAFALAEPKYRVTVNAKGKATKIELVESVGDAALDQAGVCMLESVTFQPTMQGKHPVESTAILPVTLRPPK